MSAEAPTDGSGVSVIIPAYNASAFLGETLKSVFDQTAAPGEVIVVDDSSTDDTVAIARAFGARVITVPNGGPSAARNVGTMAASGEYIAFLDADDLWAPEKLQAQLRALQSFARPAFAFTDYRLFSERGINKNGELRRYSAFRRSARRVPGTSLMLLESNLSEPVLTDSYIPPSAVLLRRADVLCVGGFDETLRVTEDYEFYLRLLRNIPAVGVMEPLFLYRRHAGQATANAVWGKAGFFEVARRVAAAPDRYPPADVLHLERTDYQRHYLVGEQHARLGQLDEAVVSIRCSLKSKPTMRGRVFLIGLNVARSKIGRRVFSTIRSLWRSRPKRASRIAG